MSFLTLIAIVGFIVLLAAVFVAVAVSVTALDGDGADHVAAQQRVSDLEDELERVKQVRSKARTAIDELTEDTLRRIREQGQ